MRKKIFIFSLLAMISSVSFSAEENFQVSALVVKPINITTTDIDFGRIMAGGTDVGVDLNQRGTSKGSINITGEPGLNIQIQIQPTVTLKRENGTETMDVIPYNGAYGNVGGASINLSAAGTWSESFAPRISTVASVSGTYLGSGKITVFYNY